MIADEVNYISKRCDEIALDRATASRNTDSGIAEGEYLDYIGGIWGLAREFGECDLYFKNRLLKKVKGEA